MNPMTNVKNIKKLSELELKRNLKTSWHDQYKDSAWIFVGGLPYDLTEGDVICVFSQYGEVVNINLVRDKSSGKSKGFCFLCYEDQRSTVLAVDNFNGIKLLGRTLRVDHVQDYKPPKDSEKKTDETRRLMEEGCAPSSLISKTSIKKEKSDDKNDCVIIEKSPPNVVDNVNNKIVQDIKCEQKDKKRKKERKISEEKEKEKKVSEKKKKKRSKKKYSSSSESDDSSSSSSESSSESSSSDSDSDDDKGQTKKHRHKEMKKKKKKSKRTEEESHDGSNKRRKLVEKIKALEKALNSVRSGRVKQEQP